MERKRDVKTIFWHILSTEQYTVHRPAVLYHQSAFRYNLSTMSLVWAETANHRSWHRKSFFIHWKGFCSCTLYMLDWKTAFISDIWPTHHIYIHYCPERWRLHILTLILSIVFLSEACWWFNFWQQHMEETVFVFFGVKCKSGAYS